MKSETLEMSDTFDRFVDDEPEKFSIFGVSVTNRFHVLITVLLFESVTDTFTV